MTTLHLPRNFRSLLATVLILITVAASAPTSDSSDDFDYNTCERDAGLLHNGEWKNYEPKVSVLHPLPDGGQLARLRPCALERFPEEKPPGPDRPMNGYLVVITDGGLNQISMGIANAVILAKVLNATLIVPSLTTDREWGDSSSFGDVYDTSHFMATVGEDVPVLEKLPPEIEITRPSLEIRDALMDKDHFLVGPQQLVTNYLHLLLKDGVLILKAWHFQVGDNLPRHLERLRCRVIFHGLRFIKPLQAVASKIVRKLKKVSGGGPFLSLHIRFDKYWLNVWEPYYSTEIMAFWRTFQKIQDYGNLTNCHYFTNGTIHPERGTGCFMTPLEIAAALKAMGIPSSTPIYLATGSIAGGEVTMKTFNELWGGNVYTKESMLGAELNPFRGFKTRLAAIDTAIAQESDLLLITSPQMMSNYQVLLQGQRFYWHNQKETFLMSDTKLRPLFQERSVNMAEVSARILRERVWQRSRSWVRWEGKDYQKTSFAWPWHCVCDVE